ncbi:Uncharacterised protein [Sphingobacterium multivorum]|uniref:hypothetical protein n=1 Tax=Sphingobacterium multivorum TaxID=28454 RepID=UPI000E05C2FB|nr:hypothetical protein [Sphingobacterium multivorum]QQT43332.1 hypothetical protein I6J00_16430 [Sphingobacterium multivorum]SUI98669.1 Uncharacterised protein [Sphingobacterium multivorum]
MKTLQDIKDEVALENDWIDWVCFKADCDITDIDIIMDIVAKRFALEVAKVSLKNAAENATITGNWDSEIGDVIHSVNKDSILSHDNIPEL